jgi:hypothetical protein
MAFRPRPRSPNSALSSSRIGRIRGRSPAAKPLANIEERLRCVAGSGPAIRHPAADERDRDGDLGAQAVLGIAREDGLRRRLHGGQLAVAAGAPAHEVPEGGDLEVLPGRRGTLGHPLHEPSGLLELLGEQQDLHPEGRLDHPIDTLRPLRQPAQRGVA